MIRLGNPPNNDEPEGLSDLVEVLDAQPDLIVTFDRDGRLLWINAAGVDLLGYPESRLRELLLSDLYPVSDAERVIEDALHEAITSGTWIGQATLVTADGVEFATQQRWVAHKPRANKSLAFTLVARPTPDAGDIELRNRRDCLLAASLGLVHDMNNCLGPITAYADLAATVIDPDSDAQRYLGQILRAAECCHDMSSRLSSLSHGSDAEFTSVDMAKIGREIVGWLRVTRPDLSIDYSNDDVVTSVPGDPVQLHQVVMNLAKNGVEALSDRAGSVSIRIDHTHPNDGAMPGEGRLRLKVSDDGRGIETAFRDRVFEPFFSTRPQGSGLGLAVSRSIVARHHGVLELEPGVPKGTVATVLLPLKTL